VWESGLVRLSLSRLGLVYLEVYMLSHEEMIGLQAEKHDLIDAHNFRSKEEYVLHLIHTFAYVQASRFGENKTVLDLGCNTGYGSKILFKSAKKVVGVDVSEKAISSANNQYGHLGIRFEQIDGKKLPFEEDEFDVIVCCQVIEHIVDYGVFIGELKRVLSPSGIVVFTTPNALLRLDPGMKPWNIFHVREFAHFELKSLLGDFFAEIQIWGLYGKEPLYSIEVNRLNKAREHARRSKESDLHLYPQYSLKSLIKTILPNSAITALRKIVNSYSNSDVAVEREFINQHGIDEFSYRPNDLEAALDLLAICSDGESNLQMISDKDI
jgi:2-polyprenyl-3-methyl-5-hydroxy-6-metoxy-1,4-benzoquinol methylase